VEFFEVSFVASNISPAFILPELGSCRRYNSAVSTAVHMPETAVNKDDFFVFDQNDIRVAGKVAFLALQKNACTQRLTSRKYAISKNMETD
jgi:hypothetical protein